MIKEYAISYNLTKQILVLDINIHHNTIKALIKKAKQKALDKHGKILSAKLYIVTSWSNSNETIYQLEFRIKYTIKCLDGERDILFYEDTTNTQLVR